LHELRNYVAYISGTVPFLEDNFTKGINQRKSIFAIFAKEGSI
jgi:hypothetical protein